MSKPIHTFEALSNTAYTVAGFYVWETSPVVGLALFYLAVGSYVAHLNIEEDYSRYDWSGMFAVFFALIAYGLGLPIVLQLAIAIVGVCIPLEYPIDELPAKISYPVIGVLWLIAMVLNWNFVSFAFFASGFIVRQIGEKYDTNPDEELWHGLWHILTAIAFVFMV